MSLSSSPLMHRVALFSSIFFRADSGLNESEVVHFFCIRASNPAFWRNR